MNRTVRTLPSSDAAFRAHVERVTSGHAFPSPEALAERLRKLFPRVVVRASVVSDQAQLWYVYRDGVWRPDPTARWWEDPRTPLVTLRSDGWIDKGNPPARSLFGLPANDQASWYFTDFLAPGTLRDAMDLFSVVAGGRELSATLLLRPAGGEVIACDVRAWPEAERIQTAFRLADDVPVEPPAPLVAEARLACLPASDLLFARYAQEALERMPEPTPDGLAIRLRRLYPHAQVEASGAVWLVVRDASGDDRLPEAWWHGEGLATVHYDRQGLILAANASAQRLLAADLTGHHWQEFVTAGTTNQVAQVLRLIEETGEAVSRFRMPGRDGVLFEFDSYTAVTGDLFVTIMRPVQPENSSADNPA